MRSAAAKMLRGAGIAFATVALLVGAAAPLAANADAVECEGTYFATSGRELFALEQQYIPPPLRPFTPDCASRIAGESFDDQVGISFAYNLVWIDVDFSEVVSIMRSFESAGWGEGLISMVDLGDGDGDTTVRLSADDLAALDPEPLYAHTRFSDANTGKDIITVDYTDGDLYSADANSIAVPSLVIEVLGTRTYGATGIADPSVLSTLRTIGEAAPTPTQAAVIGGSAVMLMLIVGYPGSLLSSVISARYDSAAAWIRKRIKPKERRPKRRPPSWLVWPGFLVAAIIGGFVDPAFGPNLMSLRVLLSGLLGFLVFNLGVWTLVRLVLARVQPDARPYVKFRWGSLVVLAAAVIVARILEFQPGVIFGLVAGLAFGMTLAASRDALVIILGASFGLIAGGLAWVGFSLLAPVAGTNPLLVFVTEFFSAVTIEAVSSLPLALLPLAVLDGAALLKWKKWVWGIAYAVGLAAFMLVLIAVPGSFGQIPGDFVRWIVLFVAFGVVAVAIWSVDNFLSRRGRRARAAPSEPAAPSTG
jgi:hypothetical protein